MIKALQMPLINLAKSSYGWSPLWLHHKMNPPKKNKITLGSCDWFGTDMERNQGEKQTYKVQTYFLPSFLN